jgi:predicted deacylase
MIQRSFPALVLTISTILMAANGCAGTSARPESAPASALKDISADTKPDCPVPVTRLTGSHPGPVLFIIAGLHGDEASGTAAAVQLAAGRAPARGTIVVIPTAAPEAQSSGQRWAPGWSDLNRAFPAESGDPGVRGSLTDPTFQRADALFCLIMAEQPFLVLDLHESDQYWTEGEGPALVVPTSTRSTELALALLETAGMEGFSFTGPPPAGSLVAAVDSMQGIPALIVEVPDTLPAGERVRLHGLVINAALRMLGMLDTAGSL